MKTEIDIKLTPDQLAEAFISWGNDEQGKFINLIGKHFRAAKFHAEFQVCSMSEEIEKDGRDFIYTLANFVKAKKFSDKSPHFDRLINTYETDGLAP